MTAIMDSLFFNKSNREVTMSFRDVKVETGGRYAKPWIIRTITNQQVARYVESHNICWFGIRNVGFRLLLLMQTSAASIGESTTHFLAFVVVAIACLQIAMTHCGRDMDRRAIGDAT
ncbi:MAG: hypothetical protein ACKVII_04115 [Planctomycetales bacterium]